jgi:hypothetical protein
LTRNGSRLSIGLNLVLVYNVLCRNLYVRQGTVVILCRTSKYVLFVTCMTRIFVDNISIKAYSSLVESVVGLLIAFEVMRKEMTCNRALCLFVVDYQITVVLNSH